MCGIIGFIGPKKDQKTVNDEVSIQYQRQQDRGTKGYGIITVDKNNKATIHRSLIENAALLDLLRFPSKMVFMHHRNPTSSDNRIDQTHPIIVDNEALTHKYFVIHNGVISNSDKIIETHEKEGFIYT
ncbi:MAG: hypothetical protein Q8P11_04340, partial [bacterium]|nr:hypothetical protein [bacterium]